MPYNILNSAKSSDAMSDCALDFKIGGKAMATNFEIAIDKNCDGFGLRLAGDFDATSAYELIYAIKTLPDDDKRLHIYTNGLKSIHPFWFEIFHKFIQSPRNTPTNYI
jgi:hypothetical protein